MLAHPRTEFSQHRPEVTGRWRSYRERKLTLMLEEPNEHRGGRHRMVIGSTAVTNAPLLLSCQLACVEPGNELFRGEPCDKHPIRPSGERTQQGVDRGRLVPMEMEPVGKSVNVISGGTLDADHIDAFADWLHL